MAYVNPVGRSIPEIFTDLIAQLTTLLRKEGQLARVEMGEKITQVGVALGLIVGGAVLLIPALVILLQAAVAALIEQGVLAAPLAALLVGGIVLLLGVMLLVVGMSRLKAEHLVPNRTIEQLRRDADVAKQQVRTSDDQLRAA